MCTLEFISLTAPQRHDISNSCLDLKSSVKSLKRIGDPKWRKICLGRLQMHVSSAVTARVIFLDVHSCRHVRANTWQWSFLSGFRLYWVIFVPKWFWLWGWYLPTVRQSARAVLLFHLIATSSEIMHSSRCQSTATRWAVLLLRQRGIFRSFKGMKGLLKSNPLHKGKLYWKGKKKKSNFYLNDRR